MYRKHANGLLFLETEHQLERKKGQKHIAQGIALGIDVSRKHAL